eukprot:189188-Alexandrium_andersonii.AAC.1
MSASLVGSEMCIRDRRGGASLFGRAAKGIDCFAGPWGCCFFPSSVAQPCLLYTSDAADDM